MTSEQIRNNLKIIYNYKFDGPHCEDTQKDTDIAILNFINNTLRQYGHLFKMGYCVILECNSIFDYLCYKLIQNISPLTTVKPKFYIIENKDADKTLFKNVTFIGLKKAKKMKRAIFISGYHPIYNVTDLTEKSKYFKTILKPFERFTPCQILQLQDFYTEKKNPYYNENLVDKDWLYRFYQYPVGLKDFNVNLSNLKTPLNIYLFELSGTEKDFKCYDFILRKDEDDAIFLYKVDSQEAADFTKLNLNPYMQRHHAPNKYNIILGTNEVFHPNYIYSYAQFLEGDK